MVPRPLLKSEIIQNIILSKSLTTSQMGKAVECGKRSVINISNNLHRFRNVRGPQTTVSPRQSVNPPMLQALCDHLLRKPRLYVDEVAIFLKDEFCVQVTNLSVKPRRSLRLVGRRRWLNRAKEQNAGPRDFYLHNLSDFQLYRFVYVDGAGCDKRIGFRRTGWSPLAQHHCR
jgi:hypothetical protein